MVERSKEEGEFDFTSEGEALGYISLAQARLLAMQMVRETPSDHGSRFSGTPTPKAVTSNPFAAGVRSVATDIVAGILLLGQDDR
jgi:homoserine kinase